MLMNPGKDQAKHFFHDQLLAVSIGTEDYYLLGRSMGGRRRGSRGAAGERGTASARLVGELCSSAPEKEKRCR